MHGSELGHPVALASIGAVCPRSSVRLGGNLSLQVSTGSGRRARHYALAVLVGAFALSHVNRQIVAILGEPLRHEFGLTDTQLGLLTGFAFALFYSTLSLPVGSWADRASRTDILSVSLLVWSSMALLCATAASYGHLLAARLGVGVGEAGASAPAQSLIADLYPPEHRTSAMAVFGSGVNLGILLAFGLGGAINEAFGWRWALVAAGAPGIVLALVVKLTLAEPLRPTPNATYRDRGVWAVAKAMSANPVVRNSMTGALLASTAGYATIAWLPSFMVRYHGLSTGSVGLIVGLQVGVLGAVGAIGGGYLADRLARRSAGWRARVVAIGFVLYLPLAATAYLAESTTVALLCVSGPALLSTLHVGVNFSLLQTHTAPSMRARTAAINIILVNLLALGGGPLWVGALSDRLSANGIEEGLRWALLSVLVFVAAAALQFARLGAILNRERQLQP